jgi:hypothetical protein
MDTATLDNAINTITITPSLPAMLGEGGQLGTHGEDRGGRIVGMGASCVVRISKNAAFFCNGMDLALVLHVRFAKVGYQSIA